MRGAAGAGPGARGGGRAEKVGAHKCGPGPAGSIFGTRGPGAPGAGAPGGALKHKTLNLYPLMRCTPRYIDR